MQTSNLKKGFALFLLLAINLVLVGYVKLESRVFADKAFLSKHGVKFVIAYKDRDENVEMYSFETLEKALLYLHDQLRVEVVPSLASLNYPIEYAWVRKDVGKSVLFWSFSGSEQLYQMTFQHEQDAEFFANALKSGAYSPSPLGHSISLLPIKEAPGRTPVLSKLVDSVQAGLSF